MVNFSRFQFSVNNNKSVICTLRTRSTQPQKWSAERKTNKCWSMQFNGSECGIPSTLERKCVYRISFPIFQWLGAREKWVQYKLHFPNIVLGKHISLTLLYSVISAFRFSSSHSREHRSHAHLTKSVDLRAPARWHQYCIFLCVRNNKFATICSVKKNKIWPEHKIIGLTHSCVLGKLCGWKRDWK